MRTFETSYQHETYKEEKSYEKTCDKFYDRCMSLKLKKCL